MTEQSDDEQHLTDENDVLEDNKSSTLYIDGNGMLVEDKHKNFKEEIKELPCLVDQLNEQENFKETSGTS